jgi:GNAT superfamily N-acetyltransferase
VQRKFHQARFTPAQLQLSWLQPLRASYHGFDKWFLQKSQAEAPLWATLDTYGLPSSLLYTKKSTQVTLASNPPLTHPDGYLKIGMICTAHPRQGFGRQCIEHAIAVAREYQVHAIYATMLPELTAASALFSSCGFSPIGERHVKGQRHLVFLLPLQHAKRPEQ